MDADRAIAIIEIVLAPKSLNPVQVQIVRGALAGESYQQIAKAAKASSDKTVKADAAAPTASRTSKRSGGRYQTGYIRETGAQLWQSLSQKLGQKVTKKNLAAALFWYAKQPEFKLAENSTVLTKTTTGRVEATASSIDRETGSQSSPDRADDRTTRLRLSYSGELNAPEHFYGRTEELVTLTQWCLYDNCRLIFLVGMGGMGKTTLVNEIARQLSGYFQSIVWRSLLNLPPIKELCTELLQCLSQQPLLNLPDSLDEQIELLIAGLKKNRCLIVLDNVESILAGQVESGQYLPGYEGYDRLLKAIGELSHQSCAILTSREKPHTIARLQIVNPQSVRSMTVNGMTLAAGHQLLQAYGCPQLPEPIWQEVHAHYAGNPLALKIAAITAVELTGGGEKVLELYPLMKQGYLQFRDIDDILYRQFERLSETEQQLVYWLAIEREPVTGAELRSNSILNTKMPGEIINALQSLSRRCITVYEDRNWSIQPVMTTYVTSRSIDRFVGELLPPDPTEPPVMDLLHQFCHLNTYAIIKAQAKDYLRIAQIQSILRPIVDRLLDIWPSRAALENRLGQILNLWRTLDPIPPGYLAGNILNLAIELATDRFARDGTHRLDGTHSNCYGQTPTLKNLDCSLLPIRSAYLADVNLHQVDFTAAIFDRCVFTQAFGGIFMAIYHPAGELLATGDTNGDVSLWQIADGQRVAIFQGHSNWTRALAFSCDGKILASASEDRTVRLWDVQTNRQIATIGPHTHTFRGMKFSRDGRQLAIGCDDCQIRIYNLPGLLADPTATNVDRHCHQLLPRHSNWVFSVAYSPDESRLASASADGTVRIWDLATGECLQTLPHEHWAIRTLFAPDGRYLVVSGMSPTIYVWDTISGEPIATLNGHRDWIWSIEMSADGRTLFSTGEDRTIRVWDLNTGDCQTVLRGHQQRIWSISLSPDGRHLVSGSEDRSIEIWDLQSGKCVKTINGYSNSIKAIAFVPARDWLASCHRDCTIRLWNLQHLVCIQTLTGHTDAVLTIAISPDGRYLASSSLDRTIRLWDLQNLTCCHTIETLAEGVCTLAFSPDGCQLIAGNYQAELQIWDLTIEDRHGSTAAHPRARIGHPKRIEAVAVCQVNRTIATACENNIRIWDLQTGECLHTIIAHYLNILTVAFSPDGRYLATGGMDKTLKVWDTSNLECLHTLNMHQSWITTVAFSPTPIVSPTSSDYHLIVGSGDRLMTRWNITTGECLQTYTGHTNWVWSLAYSPDGLTIASAGEDETIKIWDVSGERSPHTLRLQRPYEDTIITGATGLPIGQRQTLKLLGAIDD
ncbi:WD40 repeat domain-containing protein [Chamaesiphon minutus]|uniref:WD40 repeat-containing protein n=1 Tax=Chamaesiphon minutus (strain ATCC 27169 / PCC 6605) TaxID=1173020 RepID=K9UNM6_CHAP6|nr:WD40 repeat domain-containing protein [Chamaesiphon minutus]AFY95774.1 WD40 repeat-containing protein [Chamaesiphon minutus PCC 6605]